MLNELVVDRLGGHHSARCIVSSVEFSEIEALQRTGQWHEAGELLASYARGLERAGAECVVLGTNTMHKVAPAIQDAIDIPFLHVVDAVAEALERIDVATAGLLGTRFTMAENFYVDLLAERGITALVPDAKGQDDVHAVIFDDLLHGRTPAAGRQRYCEVMADLKEAGAGAIILGCTEIGLLVESCDCCIPMIDTTVEQARAAVDWALA